MDLLIAILISPILTVVLRSIAFATAKVLRLNRPSGLLLFLISLVASLLGAAISLAFTIFGMARYEATTGYSAGNGPVVWLLVTGPVSVASGILFAFTCWWFKWPRKIWEMRYEA